MAAALALAGCGEQVSVTGVVRDNFADPVAGAEITVGGRLVATTGADGEFTFSYGPGQRVPLRIDGERIAPAEYGLAVGAQRAPLEIVVQLMPPEPGLWVVRADDYQRVQPCTLTVESDGAAGVRYFAQQPNPTDTYPDDEGNITFVDTGEPVGDFGSEIAEIANSGLFYQTEGTTPALERVTVQIVPITEVRPAFQSAGRWFKGRFGQGTYVQYDRVAVPPFNHARPNVGGRCYFLRRLYG